MRIKVGCDLVEVKRFKDIDKKILDKIFSKAEIKKLKPKTLAGLFSIKECCRKVFNDLNWHDIEIIKKRNGKPLLAINKHKEIESYDISISHDGDYAIAYANLLSY